MRHCSLEGLAASWLRRTKFSSCAMQCTQLWNMIQFVTLECLRLGNWCPVIRDLWVAWGLLQRTRYLQISRVHLQQTQPEHAFIHYIDNLKAQVLIVYNVCRSMIHPGLGFHPEYWNIILGITCMEQLLIKEPHWVHPLQNIWSLCVLINQSKACVCKNALD